MEQLMVDLKTMIAVASMTYIVNLNAYELHPGDEIIFNDFIYECQGFTFKFIFVYLWYHSNLCLYTYVNDYM